ncbi:MAG TPA: hypothetical protein VF801_00410 [Rhodocyclaceae bacterium]
MDGEPHVAGRKSHRDRFVLANAMMRKNNFLGATLRAPRRTKFLHCTNRSGIIRLSEAKGLPASSSVSSTLLLWCGLRATPNRVALFFAKMPKV